MTAFSLQLLSRLLNLKHTVISKMVKPFLFFIQPLFLESKKKTVFNNMPHDHLHNKIFEVNSQHLGHRVIP